MAAASASVMRAWSWGTRRTAASGAASGSARATRTANRRMGRRMTAFPEGGKDFELQRPGEGPCLGKVRTNCTTVAVCTLVVHAYTPARLYKLYAAAKQVVVRPDLTTPKPAVAYSE